MEPVDRQPQEDHAHIQRQHPVEDPPAAAATTASPLPSSSTPTSSQTPQLKPALKSHRPSPIRRPSNPPPAMIVEGPTPKNADDADQTRDNFQLLWEKDPNLRTPTSPPDAAPSTAPVTKSVSFKDKKAAQCIIYVEPDDLDDESSQDDGHTFDNFDQLWEKDPRFVGDGSFQPIPSKVVHPLDEPGTPDSELFKIDGCDMIQKHVVTLVNCTASSPSSPSSGNRLCKSNLVYDPVAKRDRRLSFEFSYDIRNQNEEDGTADKTIRNAGVVIGCDVQVQVVLKVEALQDPERKFLYIFHHNVKVFSDFKLETKASVLQASTIEVVSSPPDEIPFEPGVVITHHLVRHHLMIMHRWAAAATPKAVLQRRMSASASQSLAHQDYFQQLDERQHESDEGEGGLTRTRSSRRRSLPFIAQSFLTEQRSIHSKP